MYLLDYILEKTNLPSQGIENTIQLLNEDCTVPFISRYRKERTGNLDEVQIGDIVKYKAQFEELEKRKGRILKSLDEKSLKNSSASFYDAVAKYNHKINDNNNLEATGYYSNDAFSISSDSLYSYNNRLMSLKWNHKFNPKNSGDLTLVNSKYKFNIEFDGNSNNDFNLGYNVN